MVIIFPSICQMETFFDDEKLDFEIQTDIQTLLENVKCQNGEEPNQEQAFLGLASLFNCQDAQNYFYDAGGVDEMVRILRDGLCQPSLCPSVLFCLACAVRNNVRSQNIVLSHEFFIIIHKILSNKEMGRKIEMASAFLIACSVSGNSRGQFLIMDTGCLMDVLTLFRVLSVENFQDLNHWATITQSISICVSNPQNEKNQSVCCCVIPSTLKLIGHCSHPKILQHILSLIGLIVVNHVGNQNRLRICGGLELLMNLLCRLRQSQKLRDKAFYEVLASTISALDLSIAENETSIKTTVEMGLVHHVFAILKECSKNTVDSQIFLLTLTHIFEFIENPRQLLWECKGHDILVKWMTESDDDDAFKAIKYIFVLCDSKDEKNKNDDIMTLKDQDEEHRKTDELSNISAFKSHFGKRCSPFSRPTTCQWQHVHKDYRSTETRDHHGNMEMDMPMPVFDKQTSVTSRHGRSRFNSTMFQGFKDAHKTDNLDKQLGPLFCHIEDTQNNFQPHLLNPMHSLSTFNRADFVNPFSPFRGADLRDVTSEFHTVDTLNNPILHRQSTSKGNIQQNEQLHALQNFPEITEENRSSDLENHVWNKFHNNMHQNVYNSAATYQDNFNRTMMSKSNSHYCSPLRNRDPSSLSNAHNQQHCGRQITDNLYANNNNFIYTNQEDLIQTPTLLSPQKCDPVNSSNVTNVQSAFSTLVSGLHNLVSSLSDTLLGAHRPGNYKGDAAGNGMNLKQSGNQQNWSQSTTNLKSANTLEPSDTCEEILSHSCRGGIADPKLTQSGNDRNTSCNLKSADNEQTIFRKPSSKPKAKHQFEVNEQTVLYPSTDQESNVIDDPLKLCDRQKHEEESFGDIIDMLKSLIASKECSMEHGTDSFLNKESKQDNCSDGLMDNCHGKISEFMRVKDTIVSNTVLAKAVSTSLKTDAKKMNDNIRIVKAIPTIQFSYKVSEHKYSPTKVCNSTDTSHHSCSVSNHHLEEDHPISQCHSEASPKGECQSPSSHYSCPVQLGESSCSAQVPHPDSSQIVDNTFLPRRKRDATFLLRSRKDIGELSSLARSANGNQGNFSVRQNEVCHDDSRLCEKARRKSENTKTRKYYEKHCVESFNKIKQSVKNLSSNDNLKRGQRFTPMTAKKGTYIQCLSPDVEVKIDSWSHSRSNIDKAKEHKLSRSHSETPMRPRNTQTSRRITGDHIFVKPISPAADRPVGNNSQRQRSTHKVRSSSCVPEKAHTVRKEVPPRVLSQHDQLDTGDVKEDEEGKFHVYQFKSEDDVTLILSSPELDRSMSVMDPHQESRKGRRSRVPYTDQEILNLRHGVATMGTRWQHILSTYQFHSCRTAVDLREKFKRLMGCKKKRLSDALHSSLPFSRCEIQRLTRGVRMFGHNWKAILAGEKFLPGRTAEDLRSKWRTLIKQDK